MQRDFTFIDDIVNGIKNIIEKELNIKANIVFKDMQAGDVFLKLRLI